MILYEYRPNLEKRKEKLLTAFLLSLALLFFVGSYLPGMPIPWVLQLFAVGLLSGGLYFAVRYLLRSFSYRLEESRLGGLDLVVVERCGRRLQTLCRISTLDVTSADAVTNVNKKQLLARTAGHRFYRYQAQASADDHYLLAFLENDETVYLLISADQRLIDGILLR